MLLLTTAGDGSIGTNNFRFLKDFQNLMRRMNCTLEVPDTLRLHSQFRLLYGTDQCSDVAVHTYVSIKKLEQALDSTHTHSANPTISTEIRCTPE